jgi:predicted HTH transcriptional regulator
MDRQQESLRYDPLQVQELRKMIARGEGATLEFKRKATFPEKVVREMIAFANTRGGTLLVGVNDDGGLTGLKFPADESHVIHDALKKCKPALVYTETFISIGSSRTIIRYDIPESLKKPHTLKVSSDTIEAYVRLDDKSLKASREMTEIVRRTQKKKDIQFHYGEPEQQLMSYLDKHPHITLSAFMALSGLKRFYASRKLVVLVLADVLRITPHEKGDLFSLAFRGRSV